MSHRYFTTGGPAWPRRSNRNVRPGLQIGGAVVMAPGSLDLTASTDERARHHGWMGGVRVYVDGAWVPHCLAYDEHKGTCLIRSTEIGNPLQLVTGRVRAFPRASRFI